jgi:hypothetical protein
MTTVEEKIEEQELKRVITFTIIGVNRAEKNAAVKAFCTKAKTKFFVAIQKNGARENFKNLNKNNILYLESAGIKVITHPANTPTGKTHIGKLSVKITNNYASYMNGIKVSVVVLGRDKKEIADNTDKVEKILLAYLRRHNIPAARMCISDSTMCIIKYTDDKTPLSELDYFDGNEPDYEAPEEEDFDEGMTVDKKQENSD